MILEVLVGAFVLWTIVEVFLSSTCNTEGGIPGHLLHDLLHAEYAQLESKSIQCSTCHDDYGVVAFVALGACASSDSNGDILVISMKREDAISNRDHTCYRQANRPEFSTSQEKSHCASMFLSLPFEVPMVFLGSYAGARGAVFEEIDEAPPRRIPKQPWYRSLWMSMAISGLVLMSCALLGLLDLGHRKTSIGMIRIEMKV